MEKYALLRTIAAIFKILAWIILVVGIVGSIWGGIYIVGELGTLGYIAVTGGVVCSVLTFIVLLAAAELIYVILDIEQNTRKTSEQLKSGYP
jgi:hypothetical protein